MKRKGLNPDKELIEEGNHRMDGGHGAMARLLRKERHPTAVLASNDMSAIGAIGAIIEHRLRVPYDISVIGFDDIAMSEYTQPPLTTVRLSRAEIAKLAFRALHGIQNAATARGVEYLIEPTLVERKSTGPVSG
jgi:LacI family transcriptional regulator